MDRVYIHIGPERVTMGIISSPVSNILRLDTADRRVIFRDKTLLDFKSPIPEFIFDHINIKGFLGACSYSNVIALFSDES